MTRKRFDLDNPQDRDGEVRDGAAPHDARQAAVPTHQGSRCEGGGGRDTQPPDPLDDGQLGTGPRSRSGLVTKPCRACGEREARLVPADVYEYADRWKQGTLTGALIPRNWHADSEAFLPYLQKASGGDEDGALAALRQVLMGRPERLWHPYVQLQVGHLITHGSHPDVPREFRDRANAALVDLLRSLGIGLGYWVTVDRAPGRRGQAPGLFPRIDEQEGMFPTPEAVREQLAAQDFLALWDDLMARLKTIRWKDVRNEYRASSLIGKDAVIETVVDELKPVLQRFLDAYEGPGLSFFAHCGLSGNMPSDESLRPMIRKALEVPKSHRPREVFGYEFLGHFKFATGGWELMQSKEPMRASPSLIKSTLRTLARRASKAR